MNSPQGFLIPLLNYCVALHVSHLLLRSSDFALGFEMWSLVEVEMCFK